MNSVKQIVYISLFLLTLFGSRVLVHAQTTIKTVAKETPKVFVLAPKQNSDDFLHRYILNGKNNAAKTAQAATTATKSTKTAEVKKESSIADNVLCWLQDKYSMMMDIMPSQITNVMLYRFIDEWYGVRYRMGGTSKKGIDCSAFVQQLYKAAFGTDLLRTAGLQFQSAIYVKDKTDLKEGDLVFFRIGTSRISHVGVYLRNNYFVHSASSKGVSIANLTTAYWAKYFAGGGRILNDD
jgi:cell wall-associated NlpC family hydrolase